jgi:2-C-methyl-D-erythritol 4-phosphate cytidylyltransferase
VNVRAVVVVGGARPALDALTPVDGVPMVIRSVRAVLASGVADRVALRGGRVHELVRACAGLPVVAWQPAVTSLRAHGGQRPESTNGDGPNPDDVVLVHEAQRPLTPPALFRAVLDAARAGHRVVAPVLPLADTVKIVDGAGRLRGTPDRDGLRVVQTPQAFRAAEPDFGRCPAGAHLVPGDPLAFAVRTPWDLAMATLLVQEGK